jgi:hypothetical protein
MVNNIFTENANKALLWEILEDSFKKIDQTDYDKFKQFFENHIQHLDSEMQSTGIGELIEQNKFFIQNTLSLIKQNEWKHKYNNLPYTSEQIKEKNINEFEQRFEQRQAEFSNLINVNKPKEVSFEDSNNKFNEDISEQLEKMQRERDKEIIYKEEDNNSFKKIKILDESIHKKKVTFNNLIGSIEIENNSNNLNDNIEIENNPIDNIETNNNMKDSIKTEFINDIKGDIQIIKNEISELKRLMTEIINKK